MLLLNYIFRICPPKVNNIMMEPLQLQMRMTLYKLQLVTLRGLTNFYL